jgi:hypothetical protein
MQTNELETQPATHRVLVVADRRVDPDPVVDALRAKAETQRIDVTVLVPATLRGLEWAGDPRATIPAAELHASLLHVALLNAGVETCQSRVGDPDPHAAVDDALRTGHFDEVLINVPSSRLTSALRIGLADRIAPERRGGLTKLRSRRRRRRRQSSGNDRPLAGRTVDPQPTT